MNTDDYIKGIHAEIRTIASDLKNLSNVCAGFEQSIRYVINDVESEKNNRKNDKLCREAAERLALRNVEEIRINLESKISDMGHALRMVSIISAGVGVVCGTVITVFTGLITHVKGWFLS